MRESVLHFGPGGRLVGILTEPSRPHPEAPAVVILNAGIIHRVGPHRLHVRLARHLARLGFPALRIDQAGIGDSLPLGERSPDEDALRSVHEALDQVTALELADRIVLFGLCAGARYAFRAAERDPRVVGVVVLDPPGLARASTARHRASHLARTAARPEVWVRAVQGRYGLTRMVIRGIGEAVSRGGDDAGGKASPGGEEERTPRQVTVDLFRTLDARGARVFFGVTAAQRVNYSYAGQIHDLFPELDLRRMMDVRMYDESDHTFPREIDRVRLESDVGEWMESFVTPLTEVAGRAPSR